MEGGEGKVEGGRVEGGRKRKVSFMYFLKQASLGCPGSGWVASLWLCAGHDSVSDTAL